MSKAKSGILLLGGIAAALIGAGISATANSMSSTPSTDWMYDLANGIGFLVSITGLVAFFAGAMWFARK
jgi:hypothetical protein